jgi:hypothetical protein
MGMWGLTVDDGNGISRMDILRRSYCLFAVSHVDCDPEGWTLYFTFLRCRTNCIATGMQTCSNMSFGVTGNLSWQEISVGRDRFPRRYVSKLGNMSHPACRRKSVSRCPGTGV